MVNSEKMENPEETLELEILPQQNVQQPQTSKPQRPSDDLSRPLSLEKYLSRLMAIEEYMEDAIKFMNDFPAAPYETILRGYYLSMHEKYGRNMTSSMESLGFVDFVLLMVFKGTSMGPTLFRALEERLTEFEKAKEAESPEETERNMMYHEGGLAFLNLLDTSKTWRDDVAQHGAVTLREMRKRKHEGSITVYRFDDGRSMDLRDLVDFRTPPNSDSEDEDEPEMKRPKKDPLEARD
ncbi:hypothetical protein METSCH_G01280 [Metschnikowia aff. pulcherrima]|uniref:Uncharacterized protein n=1 Tax=Metschnikowia aff. pulcherrima TaxID=2163413 RepID=A0A4P6XWS5_9ASCO|nr:hypothetical protein METSCH_G01280 [Metschnikowia aff. pulcherrima]